MSEASAKTTNPIIDEEYENNVSSQINDKLDALLASVYTALNLSYTALTKLQVQNIAERHHYELKILLRKLPN